MSFPVFCFVLFLFVCLEQVFINRRGKNTGKLDRVKGKGKNKTGEVQRKDLDSGMNVMCSTRKKGAMTKLRAKRWKVGESASQIDMERASHGSQETCTLSHE